MKKISLLILAALAFSCAPKQEETETDITEVLVDPVVQPADINPFIHHVYFYLKNPDSIEDRDKLVEGLNKLAEVKIIQASYIGYPANTTRDVVQKGYAVSWLCFFKNAEEEEAYQKDPDHLKFVEEYSHLWESVKVYDSVK
jgi:hypothetical protein